MSSCSIKIGGTAQVVFRVFERVYPGEISLSKFKNLYLLNEVTPTHCVQ